MTKQALPVQIKVRKALWLNALVGFTVLYPGRVFSQAPIPQYLGSYCDLSVTACPKDFANQIITVPRNTVALSAIMPICDEKIQIEKPKVIPPSIVFIIDNSGSMSMANSWNESDPDEARFSETIKMLDDIFAQAPNATVGIVSFSRRLQYDIRDPYYLAPAFPGDTSQFEAFVPLTRLDTVFPNGVTGLDTLKAMLKYGPDGDLEYDARNHPEPRAENTRDPNDMRYGTDITLGFDAAKVAMSKSTAAKANQFFIFLSDGEPSTSDYLTSERMAVRTDFVQGLNTPTTFTVFFTTGRNTGSTLIDEMTANIKANGYSTSNSLSAVWNISDPSSNLRSLLQTQILGSIVVPAPTLGQSAKLTTGTTTQTSTTFQNGAFVFQKRIPLESARTLFNFQVTYGYTDSLTQTTKDTTITYNLTIDRTGAPNPAGTDTTCHEAPQIALVANGQPVTTVNADHKAMQVVVTLPAGQRCMNCTVELGSTRGADKEALSVVGAANVLVANFNRNTTSVMVPGNGVLENLGIDDSIVVLFYNPEFPLEVSRRVFKYDDVSTVLTSKWLNDVANLNSNDPETSPNNHFILVGSPTLQATPTQGATNCCQPKAGWNPANLKDTGKYVGINIDATRGFSAQVRIYDNFGLLVNKTSFQISKEEFEKLPSNPLTKARTVGLLWNGRTREGAKVGTGVYIILGKITLLNEPGVAEDHRSMVLRRMVGVVRDAL